MGAGPRASQGTVRWPKNCDCLSSNQPDLPYHENASRRGPRQASTSPTEANSCSTTSAHTVQANSEPRTSGDRPDPVSRRRGWNGVTPMVEPGPAAGRKEQKVLQRAGAVRAMTLDINPEWVTFNFFSHLDPTNPSNVTASSLYPDMGRPATRYLGPTQESRDFFEVSAPVG